MVLRKLFFLGVCCMVAVSALGQVNEITADHVYMNNIKTVMLAPVGDSIGLPVVMLGSSNQLSLCFDDLDGDVKNYYYTLILCNADWKPAQLNPFDYLNGFIENHIDNYHFSTFPLQHYTHYSVAIPNSNCMPTRSGNYLLKVYLNSDTSQVAFTRRMYVITNKAIIKGTIQQPVDPRIFQTYQRVNFTVGLQGMNIINPISQVKVFILQNGRWDNALKNVKPTFVKADELDFNAVDNCVFPALKEWRWVDLRSFRLNTERVDHINYGQNSTDVYLFPDYNRSHEKYIYRSDLNGAYYPAMLEQGYNPDYDGDYATVHFKFIAPSPFANAKVYVFGALTNDECDESNQLTYNGTDGAYEGTLYLKQGYYNYMYGVIKDGTHSLDMDDTEGNWWETENNYTILVYYRPLGGRADELIGLRTLNSLTNR